jgi:hypothetical protein
VPPLPFSCLVVKKEVSLQIKFRLVSNLKPIALVFCRRTSFFFSRFKNILTMYFLSGDSSTLPFHEIQLRFIFNVHGGNLLVLSKLLKTLGQPFINLRSFHIR